MRKYRTSDLTRIMNKHFNNNRSMDILSSMMSEGQTVRIFGYGSLLWKPDFRYARRTVGRIQGFKRRFWQGNVTHRGTEDNIGRVATLIKSKKNAVWGEMFEVRDQEAKAKVLNGLTNREVTLGGYDVIVTTFYPRELNGNPCHVIVFIATPHNEYFLGKSDIDTMAMQIIRAKGHAGPNIDYITKMADYIRKNIPEDKCTHLFSLDRRVRELRDQSICLSISIGLEDLYETENSNHD